MLNTLPAHLVSQVFELRDGLVFFDGLVMSWIPVQQDRDCFSVELGSSVWKLADLAFHHGKRGQQHRIARKSLDAVAGMQGFKQFLSSLFFLRWLLMLLRDVNPASRKEVLVFTGNLGNDAVLETRSHAIRHVAVANDARGRHDVCFRVTRCRALQLLAEHYAHLRIGYLI